MRYTIPISVLLFALGCGERDTAPLIDAGTSDGVGDIIAPPKDVPPPDKFDPGCVPSMTCADYAGQCGAALSDGCVGTIDCTNACPATEVCGDDDQCGPKCEPDCTDKSCGDDGCGGQCGTCSPDQSCEGGYCVDSDPANCEGKVCGDDGVGGSCGQCEDGETCVDGQCEGCTADCQDKECGDDGCGGQCGECDVDGSCVDGLCVPPPTADPLLVVNELLAGPVNDDVEGDANCDGVRHAGHDEFVELVNTGGAAQDLSNATLSDDKGVKHTFADGTTLAAGGVLIVFGGGTPTLDGSSDNESAWCKKLPDGVQVVVASTGGLSLNNTGDSVIIATEGGQPLASHTYGDGASGDKGQSLVRSPELTGDFVLHSGVDGAIGPQSPGVGADGTPH